MNSYPPLRLAALNALADLKTTMAANPEFLNHEDCPYDNETKDLLRNLLEARVVEVAVEKVVHVEKNPRGRPTKDVKLSEEDQQAILDGIKKTLDELDTLDAEDTGQKIQIAKTRTSLMDQLLKMQERHYSLTKTQEFIETIVGILDDLVDEKVRESVLSRLEQFR